MATINGTDAAETLNGGAANDTINGLGGDDLLSGAGADDSLLGAAGADTLRGGAGDDWLYDGDGDDWLFGEDGDDFLRAELLGGDLVVLDGGAGDDFVDLTGSSGQAARMTGGVGADHMAIIGAAGGGATINAGGGDDRVYLTSLTGVRVTLGGGADEILLSQFVEGESATVTDYQPGIDRVDMLDLLIDSTWNHEDNPFGAGYLRLVGKGPDSVLQIDWSGGGSAWSTLLRFRDLSPGEFSLADFGGYPPDGSPPPGKAVKGTNHDDQINGGLGPDTITGRGGADTVYARSGDDLVLGGGGSDDLQGMGGDDTLRGGDDADFLSDGWGADRLLGEGGDDQLIIYLQGGGEVTANGGAGDDVISASDSSVFGQAYRVLGGAGNDVLEVWTPAVAARLDGGEGDDTVRLFHQSAVTVTLGAGADQVELGGLGGANAVIVDFDSDEDSLGVDFVMICQGWSGESNPFDDGYIRLRSAGADTLLQIDVDGAGHDWITALRFRGVAPGEFDAADFGGWDPGTMVG